MQCPKCGSAGFSATAPCPDCGFKGGVALLERRLGLQFLLSELQGWTELPYSLREHLRGRYGFQLREVDIALRLREPPPDAATVHALQQERTHQIALRRVLPIWVGRGWLTEPTAREVDLQAAGRIREIEQRLAEVASDNPLIASSGGVAQANFYIQKIEALHAAGLLTSESAYEVAAAEAREFLEQMEIRAGLRRQAVKLPTAAEAAPATGVSPRPARPSREPIHWDRAWESLFSEQTMRVLLFMGVALIFGAGVSLVVWNWEIFPPWLQVIFIGLVTGTFYAVGGYVRNRMRLQSSGLALIAVGSLLVPVDFYAVYLFGKFPVSLGDDVWLLASGVCLIAYLITVWRVQADFFGYLVGIAAGSFALAGMTVAGFPVDIRPAVVMAAAGGVVLIAEPLRVREGRWKILAVPFWHLALAAATVVLPLSFGWRFTGRADTLTFSLALAGAWWLGGGVYFLALRRYPGRTLALVAALVFPVAAWLTQRVLLAEWAVPGAWHALGWALLAPGYLIVARRLARPDADALHRAYGQIAGVVAVLLMVAAAAWSLNAVKAVGTVHPLLAATVVLAVGLWRRPGLLPFASLLLMTGTAAWLAGQEAALTQLGLAWALLAVAHVIVALGMRRLGRPALPDYRVPLYAAAWVIAAFSVVPPLALFDRPILIYTLGNWIALNGWLALLAHTDELPELLAFLSRMVRRPAQIFHWAAALSLLPWVALLWTDRQPVDVRLSLVYAGAAFALLAFGSWLRRARWAYGRPWQTAAHFAMLVSLGLLPGPDRRPWIAGILLLAAVFYFASAWRLHRREWLLVGGCLFPIGVIVGFDWLGGVVDAQGLVLALIAAAYMGIGSLLERRRPSRRHFLAPLYWALHLLVFAALIWTLLPAVDPDAPDSALLWASAGTAVLALVVGAYSWRVKRGFYGHIAAWLGLVAGGLVASAYSQGRGSSAAKLALLSIAYVLTERALLSLGRSSRVPLARRPALRQAWRLYRGPLLVAGWWMSMLSVVIAVARNVLFLGGGAIRETWAVVGLLLIVGLYALSARLFRRSRFLWLAGALMIIPWTILTHRGWYLWSEAPAAPRYALAWLILAGLELAGGIGLAWRLGPGRWSRPLRGIAYLLAPAALLWGAGDTATSSVTFGLGTGFYLLAAWADRRFRPSSDTPPRARFLYPAVGLLPAWACFLLHYYRPEAQSTTYGLLVLGFSLPMLLAGWQMARREPAYRWPFYLAAGGTALLGTALVAHDRPVLIGALLYDAVLAALAVGLFREPLWIYPVSGLLPAVLVLALAEWHVPGNRHGWSLIALGGAYLAGARLLGLWRRSEKLEGKGRWWVDSLITPLFAAAFVLIAAGLIPSSRDRWGAIVGYGGAVLFYAAAAVWLVQPLLLTTAVALAIVPYWALVLELRVAPLNYGPALWPPLLAAWGIALWIDRRWEIQPEAGETTLPPFPWGSPGRWPTAMIERLFRWWALPFYGAACGGVLLSALLAAPDSGRFCLTLFLAAGLYGWAAYHFRLRGWLLLAAAAAQLAVLAGWRWWNPALPGAALAFRFIPVVWATALAGLAIQQRLGEAAPGPGRWLSGWSRPLYGLALFDLLILQCVSVFLARESAALSLSNALLLALLASAWMIPWLMYLPPLGGLVALGQYLIWQRADELTWPWALALLALGYGGIGYGLRWWQYQDGAVPVRAKFWEAPLRWSGWGISFLSLGLMIVSSGSVIMLVVWTVLRWPMFAATSLPRIQMVVSVLALLGLLYLTAALVDRRRRLGYGALFLLLGAWSLEWLLVWGMREVQWYAIPAGLYLLGVGAMEWEYDSRAVARWIDRVAVVLLLGSVFWQSLGASGWRYALLMVFEGLALVGWGSVRRLRRFLYAGVAGVMVAAVGQMIDPFLSANWIVYAVIGLVLIGLAILIEPRLKEVQALSQEVRERLETWE